MSVRSEKNGGGAGATGAHVAARALDLLRGLRVLLPQVLSLLVRGLLFLLLLLLLGAGAPSSGACHGPCRVSPGRNFLQSLPLLLPAAACRGEKSRRALPSVSPAAWGPLLPAERAVVFNPMEGPVPTVAINRLHRLRRLTGHLHTAAAAPTADSTSDLTPVPIAVPHSGGHVHPSICVTADGTLVVVYAIDVDKSQGKGALVCVTSRDSGASWTAPAVIDASTVRPATIRDTGNCEIYPGTLQTLPDDRILVTWQYRALGDADYPEGALCFALSETQGSSWGSVQTIVDPANPPDINSNEPRHLGAMRHGMLTMEDGRWLLPLRDPKPEPDSAWGPRLYDPLSKAMEDFSALWPGADGAHPAVRGPIKQIVRTAAGSLLAMSAGGGPYTPPGETVLHPAPVLHRSSDPTAAWTDVSAGFPAASAPAAGVSVEEWDDDGDREGRFLCPLEDGRVLALWAYAHDPAGIQCNVSGQDGLEWEEANAVTVLPHSKNAPARASS